MVISLRLDEKEELLFKDLEKKIVGKNQLKVHLTKSQVIKAVLYFAADHCGLNTDKYKGV